MKEHKSGSDGMKEKKEDILVEFRWVITIQLEVHGLSVAQVYIS